MNIIFLTVYRIINIQERGIYTDLIRKFRDEGHQIYVVTPVERRYGKSTSLIIQDGVHILGVRTLNMQKTNVIEKGVNTLLIQRLYKRAITKYLRGVAFDLILHSTPPITLSGVINNLKKHNPAISYLLLKDIFPQNAVDLQMFGKHSLFNLYFRRKEKVLYRSSDYIGCMSPANVEFLLKHNPELSADRVEVNPNSVELVHMPDINVDEVRRRNHLPLDKVIFIYGGNLGKPQGLDFLLQVLDRMQHRTDSFFLIIGTGTAYNRIRHWLDKHPAAQARLMAGLPKAEYDTLVRACDVGLIFLDPRFTIPNYPSRLLTYLENRMPILAATDSHTDIGSIAEANGYGLWCRNGDIDTFMRFVDRLSDAELRSKMGERGFDYLKKEYLVSVSYNKIKKRCVQVID